MIQLKHREAKKYAQRWQTPVFHAATHPMPTADIVNQSHFTLSHWKAFLLQLSSSQHQSVRVDTQDVFAILTRAQTLTLGSGTRNQSLSLLVHYSFF